MEENISEISYEIYVVGRNEEGTSKPSNIESIKDIITKDEEKPDDNNDNNNDGNDDSENEDNVNDNDKQEENEEESDQNQT